MHAVHEALPRWPALHGVVAFVAYAVAILATGALLHYAIERPFLRLRTRLSIGHHGPAAVRLAALALDG